MVLSNTPSVEKRNIIVIGASAGGVDALKKLLAPLPADLDAAIFIVWHMAPSIRGILPQMLSHVTPIAVSNALNGEPVQANHIYVAPPDHHLLLENGHVRITRGPKENRFRPAIDPLFRSAALHYGNRVIGVILSGALDDGTAGLWTIKEQGGLALVQDPDEAEVPSMPESAIREVAVDHVLPAGQLGAKLVELVKQTVSPTAEVNVRETQKTTLEIQIAVQETDLGMTIFSFGELSPYTCPECHGVLTMLKEGSLARFRCHTGHAYSVDTLLAAVTETVEDNLYSTLRSMDETVILLNHLGDHYAEVNQTRLAALYFQKAQEAQSRSDLVRQTVENHQILGQNVRQQQADEMLDDNRFQ